MLKSAAKLRLFFCPCKFFFFSASDYTNYRYDSEIDGI